MSDEAKEAKSTAFAAAAPERREPTPTVNDAAVLRLAGVVKHLQERVESYREAMVAMQAEIDRLAAVSLRFQEFLDKAIAPTKNKSVN